MIKFLKPRWKIILGLLIFVGLLATGGIWLGVFIPVIGTPIFLWPPCSSGIFRELFSTGLDILPIANSVPAPNAWQGYLLMFIFYLVIAIILSIPFGRSRN